MSYPAGNKGFYVNIGDPFVGDRHARADTPAHTILLLRFVLDTSSGEMKGAQPYPPGAFSIGKGGGPP